MTTQELVARVIVGSIPFVWAAYWRRSCLKYEYTPLEGAIAAFFWTVATYAVLGITALCFSLALFGVSE